MPGFWWSLISAVLAIVVGGMLVAEPIRGSVSLTLLLIAFFIIEGVVSVMFALDHRKELPGAWGWMLASGVVDLALATMILAGLPGTAVWVIGLLVGISRLERCDSRVEISCVTWRPTRRSLYREHTAA